MEPEYKIFASSTFYARCHPGESCGSNGLPLTPSSITILGRAQKLLTLQHRCICTYLDIVRGKHERIIIVSELNGTSLKELKRHLSFDEITFVAYQLVDALSYLHDNEIIHRTLAPDNIFIDSQNNVKLFNYGMYYMTDCGKHVAFPLGIPKYLSLETILNGGSVSSDIWSLGIILLELCLGTLWPGLKPGPVLRRLLTLVQSSSPAERIAREHDNLNAYQSLPPKLKQIIDKCLKIMPSERATVDELKSLLQEESHKVVAEEPARGLLGCKLKYLYHWWQLAGGDIQAELRKQGLIKNTPPILTMPIAVLLDGCTIGGEKETLMDRRIAKYSLDSLRLRLSHIPAKAYYPLMTDCKRRCETVTLPKIIRERDTEYQFHRLILFDRLLYSYPYTREEILSESSVDIPPLLRGEVWAALLGVVGDIEEQYERIDKETPTATDRQIDVDIPRCHQYCWLLSGAAGHHALKRLLKAWLLTHPQYVYWQGLDSLTAPFLYLNFNHEARAFACLSAFVPKFLHKFFLKDNSSVIKEYLAKFRQLTAYHEPALACHLHHINFVPELFAIPWFLTMFSHVFPLHKIVHLWDALLVAGDALPLLMGVAILRQLRDTLLGAGFNECILLFSDLPEIDIGECVKESVEMCHSSPKSISYRVHRNYPPSDDPMDDVEISLDTLLVELCPRLSCNDLMRLLKEDRCLIIDIRSNLVFEKSCVEGSVNIPYSGIHLGVHELSSLGERHERALAAAAREARVVAVVSSEDETAQLFSDYLVKCGVAQVCILHGGVAALQRHLPHLFTS